MSKFQNRLTGLADKLDKVIKDNTEIKKAVQSEFDNMKKEVASLKDSIDVQKNNFEIKVKEIEGNFSGLVESVQNTTTNNAEQLKDVLVPMVKEEIIEVVKKDLKDELLPSVHATWLAIQRQQVWELSSYF